MSNEAQKRSTLSPEEIHRLTAFFSLLIAIDQREQVTTTAQKQSKKEYIHEA